MLFAPLLLALTCTSGCSKVSGGGELTDADFSFQLPPATRPTEACAAPPGEGLTTTGALMSTGDYVGKTVRVRGRIRANPFGCAASRVDGYCIFPAFFLDDGTGGVEVGGSKDFGGVDDSSQCSVVTGVFRTVPRGAALLVEPTAAELARDAAAETIDAATIMKRPRKWVGRVVRLQGTFEAERGPMPPNCMVVQGSSGKISGTCATSVQFVDGSSTPIGVFSASCTSSPAMDFPPGCGLGTGRQEIVADVVAGYSTGGLKRVPLLRLRTTKKLAP